MFRVLMRLTKAHQEENPPLPISKERCRDLDQEKLQNRIPLLTLMQQNPDTYRLVRFTGDGTIVSINTTCDWYYESCSKCAAKVIDGADLPQCPQHGLQPNRAYRLGKSKKASHPLKTANTNTEVLHTLHMDLCGPMRTESINGKKYVLVIVDDYTRFGWVRFLRSKDETPQVIEKFIVKTQRALNATVRFVRTDNGTEFVNKTLDGWFESVGISHETSVPRSPQHVKPANVRKTEPNSYGSCPHYPHLAKVSISYGLKQ
ncbi:retrovirus-related pol polyprotein from transposon TNT 1-94 [Tanacetum coccineum]